MLENNDKLNELINNIIGDYFTTFNYDPFSFSLVIAEDIWTAYFDLRPDLRTKLPTQLPNFNGTVVTPVNLDGTFTVIIDKKYFVEDTNSGKFSWVGTVAHEITHVKDYKEYVDLIRASNYDEVLNMNKHRMFYLWTEFNAKRHGYYFARKYTFENLNDVAQVPNIMNKELPGQIAYMTKQYNSTTDGWKQIYAVSQFLGHLAVWKDLFPEQFNQEFIEKILSSNSWIVDMYAFLNANRKLSTAINNFDVLRSIMQRNFKGA